MGGSVMANVTGNLVGPELSVVFPAYNENTGVRGGHFRDNLYRTQETLARVGASHEIIVVDDGSTDSTADVARSFGVEVVGYPDNRGKGAATRLGLLSAKGSLRAFADADGSYSPETILGLFEALRQGADIATVNRDSHASIGRRAVHFGLEKLCDLFAPTDVVDTQAGAKAFTAQATEGVWRSVDIDSYAADRQALYIAHVLGLKITEVEAEVTPVGNSHVRFRDAIRLVLDSSKIGKATKAPALSSGLEDALAA